MLTLHNLKGGISGQVFKELLREDVALLASNLNRVEGIAWQTVIKFRKSNVSLPLEFGYALCMHSANEKEPFVIGLSEDEVRQKLKSWNFSAVEIEKLLKTEVN